MALPTRTDLVGLNYAFWGSPFLEVPAKTGVDVLTMDIAFNASPFVGNLIEDAGGGGTTNVLLEETLSVTDAIAIALNLNPLLSETLTITDAVSYGRVYSELLSETLSLTDSLVYVRAVVDEQLQETLSLDDVVYSSVTRGRILADPIDPLSDALSVGFDLSQKLTESFSITDTLAYTISHPAYYSSIEDSYNYA